MKEFADEFQVSTRTIKYDLENIRLWLENQIYTVLVDKAIGLTDPAEAEKLIKSLSGC